MSRNLAKEFPERMLCDNENINVDVLLQAKLFVRHDQHLVARLESHRQTPLTSSSS